MRFILTIALLSLISVHAGWWGELQTWTIGGAVSGATTGGAIGYVAGSTAGVATGVAATAATGGAAAPAVPVGAAVGGASGTLVGTVIGGVAGAVSGPAIGFYNSQHLVKPGLFACSDPEGIRFPNANDTYLGCWSQGTIVRLGRTEDIALSDMLVTSSDRHELLITVTYRIEATYTPKIMEKLISIYYKEGVTLKVTALEEPIQLWFGKYQRSYTEAEYLNPEFFDTTVATGLTDYFTKKLGASPFLFHVVKQDVRRA
jgi:hypothetical protein